MCRANGTDKTVRGETGREESQWLCGRRREDEPKLSVSAGEDRPRLETWPRTWAAAAPPETRVRLCKWTELRELADKTGKPK